MWCFQMCEFGEILLTFVYALIYANSWSEECYKHRDPDPRRQADNHFRF
ncbi:Unknown protein sequence [Pseudomonas coronafaciens pv. oryzae]|nr:Unknown protein sequence [Pseudomonas coronafaciens pv. oryzae]